MDENDATAMKCLCSERQCPCHDRLKAVRSDLAAAKLILKRFVEATPVMSYEWMAEAVRRAKAFLERDGGS